MKRQVRSDLLIMMSYDQKYTQILIANHMKPANSSRNPLFTIHIDIGIANRKRFSSTDFIHHPADC